MYKNAVTISKITQSVYLRKVIS